MFKKILAAVDGSENSMRAASVARDLAVCMSAGITLVYAAYVPEMYSVDVNPEVKEALHEEGRRILYTSAKLFKGSGIEPIERLVFDERPDEAILRLVNDEAFDLVVIGSRGLHATEIEALGSTSMLVLDNAPCPVLVVH